MVLALLLTACIGLGSLGERAGPVRRGASCHTQLFALSRKHVLVFRRRKLLVLSLLLPGVLVRHHPASRYRCGKST